MQFRSKAVILSNGGSQALYANFYTDFPFMSERKDRLIMAGHFLKKDCFKQTMARVKEKSLKNIVIVGGSHSGFSAAWMMLNGPAFFNKNTSINTSKHTQFPEAMLKQTANCGECCACSKKKKDAQC